MKPYHWGISVLVLIVLAAVLFPVVQPYLNDGKRDAYRHVLHLHSAANAPQQINKQPSFLYLSWFLEGDPRHAEQSIIYVDGRVMKRLVLWNHTVRGSGGKTTHSAALRALKAFPPLPPGLASPDDVAYADLLIVSQGMGTARSTRYYDRRRLPGPVQRLQELVADVSLQ